MPFFDGQLGKVYYRDWAIPQPTAGIIFSHGYGENSGLFHRFAFAANAAGFRVWGIDAIGHGLSDGPRGKAPVDALAANVLTLTRLAQQEAPGLPLVLVGHSMGSIASALAAIEEPETFRGLVLTGSPILDFDPAVLAGLDVTMSRDPFYLDQLDTDPLEQWLKDDQGPDLELARYEDAIWSDLPKLDVPILFINGEEDPIAPPAMGRRAAERCRHGQAIEIANGCHDIINDAPHVEVTNHILDLATRATATA